MKNVANLVWEEDGQGLTEYTLIMLAVAMVAIYAVFGFGQVISSSLNDTATKIP